MPTATGTRFSTVYSDNFGSDGSLNRSLWHVAWGNSSDYSFGNGALTLTSRASEGWRASGFLTSDFNRTSGTGYGLYSVTMSLNGGEGAGAAVLLWPADNKWPGAELDMFETWGSTRSTAFATIHYRGSNGGNGYSSHPFALNLTQKNTFAMDWEQGSITYYVNGNKIFQTSSHVPNDAAHGGVNEAFGAEIANAGNHATSSSTSLHLYNMSYAKPVGSYAASASTVVPASATSSSTVSAATGSASGSPTFLSSSHATVGLQSGERLIVTGSGDRLVLPAAGGVTLSGSGVASASFDLRSLMPNTSWNGNAADLWKTMWSKPNGQNLEIMAHSKGGGASIVVATIEGAANAKGAFLNFEHHSIFR